MLVELSGRNSSWKKMPVKAIKQIWLLSVARNAAARSGEPRTLTSLLLESIALRHQIAVLERSGTRRSCFRV
jgi:hypothetical protein